MIGIDESMRETYQSECPAKSTHAPMQNSATIERYNNGRRFVSVRSSCNTTAKERYFAPRASSHVASLDINPCARCSPAEIATRTMSQFN